MNEIPPFLRRDVAKERELESVAVCLPVTTVAALHDKLAFSDYVFPAPEVLDAVVENALPTDVYNRSLVVLKRLRAGLAFHAEAPDTNYGEDKERDITVWLRGVDVDTLNGVLIYEIDYWQNDFLDLGWKPLALGQTEHMEEGGVRQADKTKMLLFQLNQAYVRAGGQPRSILLDYLPEGLEWHFPHEHEE